MDKAKLKSDLLEKGILFITKEDVTGTMIENSKLKLSIMKKLSYSSIAVLMLLVVTVFLTFELSAIRVGDIGAYTPSGDTVILNPKINPRPDKYDAYRFATNSAIAIRTFWFSTYYSDLEALEPLFTKEAYDEYLISLQSSGLLGRVKSESINVTAALSPRNAVNGASRFVDNSSFFYVRVRLLLRLENLSGEDEFMTEDIFFELKEVSRGLSKHGLLITSMEIN